jgi:hypothetical protein
MEPNGVRFKPPTTEAAPPVGAPVVAAVSGRVAADLRGLTIEAASQGPTPDVANGLMR